MGINNFVILNALRKLEEGVDTAQQAAANVAEQAAEGQQQPFPPPVVQIQQLDGTASSTPSRSNASLQAYDEYDPFYGDDQPQGRQRRPQGRPMGKADKVPIWKGASYASPHGSTNQNIRSGSTFISFHINGPGKSVFLLDTGAQRSCIGKCTFVEMGGDLKSLRKSKNSFIFGDGPSTPSLGRAKIDILGHAFNIDIVSRDICALIGMDILSKSI
jgi:hypothetical protein